jgi:hypothetical protein
VLGRSRIARDLQAGLPYRHCRLDPNHGKYGVGQTWLPLGFLVPSPEPADWTFEFWRGAGQIASAVVEMAGGFGLLGGGAAGAGAGFIGAVPTGGASLALTAVGVSAVAVGVAAVSEGGMGVLAGLQTLANSVSLSMGLGSGSSTPQMQAPAAGEGLPKNPNDLLKQGYKETSHPKAAASGHRTFENPEMGDVLRFDKGRPGAPGHAGKDHYHRANPHKTCTGDACLDRFGSPTPKGSDASHLYPNE